MAMAKKIKKVFILDTNVLYTTITAFTVSGK